MRSFFRCAAVLVVSLTFMSCVSTKVYTKQTRQFFVDDELVLENYTFVKGKEDGSKKKTVEHYEKKLVPNSRALLQTAGDNVTVITSIEEVTVKSTPNSKYIAYTFLGKPFVILGSAGWNLLKCAGYACINFLGGYASYEEGEFSWMMPDVKEAWDNAAIAHDANKIEHYPEYHIPFTDNEITVKELKEEKSSRTTNLPNGVLVSSTPERKFINGLEVKRSVESDFDATTSIVGLVGTAVTVPVSGLTWVGGFAAGLYFDTIGK